MAFRIERNDLIRVTTDAIVNTANPLPTIGSGLDSVVYNAAGAELLLDERKRIGTIEPGQARYTKSFNLRKTNSIKYIIHTVGINWIDGNHGEIDIIRECYRNSLQVAYDLKCKTVAIPLLATGNFGFPKELALNIAIEEIQHFIYENDLDVILVVYDKQSFQVSEKIFNDIKSCIDEYYVGARENTNTDVYNAVINNTKALASNENFSPEELLKLNDFVAKSKSFQSFQDLLRQLIQKKGLDNPTVYKRSVIVDKKLFSKIMNGHIPNKHSAMALGLALELDLPTYELFLATANVALNPFDMADTVVKYCITRHIFDVMKIDTILFQMDLPCFNK